MMGKQELARLQTEANELRQLLEHRLTEPGIVENEMKRLRDELTRVRVECDIAQAARAQWVAEKRAYKLEREELERKAARVDESQRLALTAERQRRMRYEMWQRAAQRGDRLWRELQDANATVSSLRAQLQLQTSGNDSLNATVPLPATSVAAEAVSIPRDSNLLKRFAKLDMDPVEE